MTTTLQNILFSVVLIATVKALPQAQRYPIRLQPELDAINVEDYFRNERLLDLQIKCVVYDGPCDAVGRWVKRKLLTTWLVPPIKNVLFTCTVASSNEVVNQF